MEKQTVERVLGRPIFADVVEQIETMAPFYKGHRVLVTGASGSIGRELFETLRDKTECELHGWDIDPHIAGINRVNILDEDLWATAQNVDPTIVFHLAAAKHAPAGEVDRWITWQTNIVGTQNIVDLFPNAHIVLASTCKACDPETVYGASKLIAEREVIGIGGSVARFYNTVETQGNVFEIWEEEIAKNFDKADLKVVAECRRYFMSVDEAIGLLIATPFLPRGRWTIGPMVQRDMKSIFDALYPGFDYTNIKPRRGDRVAEPLHANCETLSKLISNFYRIESPYDGNV